LLYHNIIKQITSLNVGTMKKIIASTVILIGGISATFNASAQGNNQETECVRPANPYKMTSFDNDFSYLDQDCYTDSQDDFLTKAGDSLKRIDLGNDIKLDLGGEYRLRYHNENNGARRRIGVDNSYFLSRFQAYANLEINKNIRFYGTFLDASIFDEDLPPVGSDVNRHDLLNGFVDLNFDVEGTKIFVRAGRQEMTFGQRRQIAVNNWVNVKRAFDGVRAAISRDNLTLSVFSVNPRRVLADQADPTNDNQDFDGASIQYTASDQDIETYVYRLNQDDPLRTTYKIYTIGARYKGSVQDIMLEAEGAIQRGDFGTGDINAEFFVVGIGHQFKDVTWKPTIWAHYDYHSGDGDPTDGVNDTYFQLFPAAHAWMGLIDFTARQNLKSIRVRATVNPTKKLSIDTQLHKFNLAEARGAFFNASRVNVRQDPTGAAGTDLGMEFDITAKYRILQRAEILVGYSRFWGGNFIDATNPVGTNSNADFLYTHLRVNF